MKCRQIVLLALPVLGLAGGGLTICQGADNDSLENNRFSLSYRVGFNISTSFRNIGVTPFANNPSITGLSYADGFVGTDSTGNAGGFTTRFGYQSASQAADGNNSLLLHNNSAGSIADHVRDEPSHGFEITLNHELGRGEKIHWGLEGAFNWFGSDFHQSGTASTGTLSVDAFSLGYAPTPGPFIGQINAGPFIPVLGTAATSLPVSVNSSLLVDLFGLRLGPYIDIPIGHSLSVSISAGLALTLADGHYSNIQSFTTPGGVLVSTSSSVSGPEFVPGGYVSGQIMYRFCSHWKTFAGFQYQVSDSYSLRAGGMEAKIDLGAALFCTVGMSYSF